MKKVQKKKKKTDFVWSTTESISKFNNDVTFNNLVWNIDWSFYFENYKISTLNGNYKIIIVGSEYIPCIQWHDKPILYFSINKSSTSTF